METQLEQYYYIHESVNNMEYTGWTYKRIQMPKIGFESTNWDWLRSLLSVDKSTLELTNATPDN